MKALVLALTTLAVSVSANASHWGEFDGDALQAINIVMKCPKEAAELMNQPFMRVTAGSYVGGMTPDGVGTTYSVTFTQTYPMPSGRTNVRVLSIQELIKRVKGELPPDHPGTEVKIDCKVINQQLQK